MPDRRRTGHRVEAGPDAGFEAGSNAGSNAGFEAGSHAGPDTRSDTPSDARFDAEQAARPGTRSGVGPAIRSHTWFGAGAQAGGVVSDMAASAGRGGEAVQGGEGDR